MYSVNVRDHFMIAHSFRGETFGPAQARHGATYVVDATFFRSHLDDDGVVVDIARAGETLKAILAEFNLRDLDEEPAFVGQNTTTEFLAGAIHERLAARIVAGDLGPGGPSLEHLRVTLHESHIAWAAYEAALPGAR
ncbi:6-pyruvoyl trahydropterin synthase family protein [Halofilum ochraceum]|uniref:6-pyruvoyl trahydropterin synthase family protein n=1 Tax=Halofilum ochraceum TaxID=1611323 RepID=UPI0008DB0DC5|nr:6-carboxytetrahydropterin synthase [Halofilum ochraceum]